MPSFGCLPLRIVSSNQTLRLQLLQQFQDLLGGSALHGFFVFEIPFHYQFSTPIDVHVPWWMVTFPREENVSSSADLGHW